MKRVLISSGKALPVPATASQAARAGQLMYISGQVGVKPSDGLPIMGFEDLPAKGKRFFSQSFLLFELSYLAPTAAQTYWIMDNMKTLLAEQGASLDDLVKLNVYLQDLKNYEGVELVFQKLLGKNPPACTILEMEKRGVHEDLRVCIDGVAVIPSDKRGAMKKEIVNTEEAPAPTGHYSQAVKCGNLLFISGLLGEDPQTGELVRSFRDLGPDGKRLKETFRTPHRRQEKVRAQMWQIFKNTEKILRAAGTSLDQLLICFTYTRDMYTDFYSAQPIIKMAIPHNPPGNTDFGMPDIRRDPDAMIEMEAIAFVPGNGQKRKVDFVFDPNLTRPTFHYTMATAAGPYFFSAGRTGINWQREGVCSMRPADMHAWGGQKMALGRLHEDKPVMAQAWYAYKTIQKMLATQGATMDDIVKTNIWLGDLGTFPEVEAVSREFFPNGAPAATMIPVKNFGPSDDLRLEIDVTAILPKGPRSGPLVKIQ